MGLKQIALKQYEELAKQSQRMVNEADEADRLNVVKEFDKLGINVTASTLANVGRFLAVDGICFGIDHEEGGMVMFWQCPKCGFEYERGLNTAPAFFGGMRHPESDMTAEQALLAVGAFYAQVDAHECPKRAEVEGEA